MYTQNIHMYVSRCMTSWGSKREGTYVSYVLWYYNSIYQRGFCYHMDFSVLLFKQRPESYILITLSKQNIS